VTYVAVYAPSVRIVPPPFRCETKDKGTSSFTLSINPSVGACLALPVRPPTSSERTRRDFNLHSTIPFVVSLSNHEWYCDTTFSRKRRSERTVAPNYFHYVSGAVDLAHILGTLAISPKIYFRISFDIYLYLPTYIPVLPKLLNRSVKSSKWNRNGFSWPKVSQFHTCFCQPLSSG
jgi:hypothetical protein